jgi:hypothetical protein
MKQILNVWGAREGKIKMVLREIEMGDKDWIDLA